uniref:Uncharacterized protein n=1 Tax=Accipiter nisus TaxID=211598 RepID=A0A8B9N700_9AVES
MAQYGPVWPGIAQYGLVQPDMARGGAGDLAQWVLVELQGEVEPRQSGELAGSFLGDLHYTHEPFPGHLCPLWVLVGSDLSPRPRQGSLRHTLPFLCASLYFDKSIRI